VLQNGLNGYPICSKCDKFTDAHIHIIKDKIDVLEKGGLSQFMRGGGGHEKSVGECFDEIFWEQVRKGTEGEGRKEARLRGLTINCHDGKTNK